MRFALFLGILLMYSTCMTATRPIIPLYASDALGVSPLLIGALVSGYAILPIFLALKVGKLLDRYGACLTASVGGVGIMAALLVPAAVPNFAGIFISQLLSGFCNIFVIMSFQKTVGNQGGNRDLNLMWLTLMFSFSELLGPPLGGFSYEHFGFALTLLLSAAIALAAVVAGLTIDKAHWRGGVGASAGRQTKFVESLGLLQNKNVRNVLLLSGLILYSKDLFVAYLPIYGAGIGLGAGWSGLILSFASGMAIAIRLGQYWLLRTLGRERLLFVMLIVSGLCFAAIPFFSLLPVLFVFAGLIGAGLGLGQPISLAYSLAAISRERHGEILGLRVTTNKVLQFAAPFLFGMLGEFAGVLPIFMMSGLCLCAGAFGIRLREEQTGFR